MRPLSGPLPAVIAFLLVAGLAFAARALGFADGLLLAATPASGAALAAAVLLRWRGVLATAAGFASVALAAGLGPAAAFLDGSLHGLAALVAATLMRIIARRMRVLGRLRNRTVEWLISFAGAAGFTVTLAISVAVAAAAGLFARAGAVAPDPVLVLAFQPLGILTFGAVLASLGEARSLHVHASRTGLTVLIAIVLSLALWGLLTTPIEGVRPSGVTLILSLPFCIWVGMQPRSLDGALVSFVAAHVVLLMVLTVAGPVDAPDFVVTTVYLNLLVAICQLLHALNRDRLDALAEVEEQKRILEERVVERTARLAAATAAAQAADAAKSRFIAMVSHEVRTPLSGILGMTSLVLEGRLDAATRTRIEIIRSSGLHLLDVIDRILDFSRLERPTEPPTEPAFDLGRLVQEVLDEARVLPYAGGVRLEAEMAQGLVLRRCGDRRSLRQVLTNLVGNALKFTDEGTVTVSLSDKPDGRLVIEVADTGVGIPPELRAKVFEPFERVGQRSRHGGTGLGLTICAELVSRLGGTISVRGGKERGTVFRVELPMAAVPTASPELTGRQHARGG